MIALIKPILFAFFKSDAVKKLLVDLLAKLAKAVSYTHLTLPTKRIV